MCDGATWRLLLGQDAQPNDLLQLRSGESDDEDLGDQVGGGAAVAGGGRWRQLEAAPAQQGLGAMWPGGDACRAAVLPPPPQNADRVWLIGEQRWEDRSRVKRG